MPENPRLPHKVDFGKAKEFVSTLLEKPYILREEQLNSGFIYYNTDSFDEEPVWTYVDRIGWIEFGAKSETLLLLNRYSHYSNPPIKVTRELISEAASNVYDNLVKQQDQPFQKVQFIPSSSTDSVCFLYQTPSDRVTKGVRIVVMVFRGLKDSIYLCYFCNLQVSQFVQPDTIVDEKKAMFIGQQITHEVFGDFFKGEGYEPVFNYPPMLMLANRTGNISTTQTEYRSNPLLENILVYAIRTSPRDQQQKTALWHTEIWIDAHNPVFVGGRVFSSVDIDKRLLDMKIKNMNMIVKTMEAGPSKSEEKPQEAKPEKKAGE